MTIDEFATGMRGVSEAARERLGPRAAKRKYFSLPVPVLQRIYERHRNINFRTPSSRLELVHVTLGFMGLEIIHTMKRRYFEALPDPCAWEPSLAAFTKEANDLVEGILAEFDEAPRTEDPNEPGRPTAEIGNPDWLPERELKSVSFIIDANCVNSKRRLPAINLLEDWAASGLFLPLLTTEVAQREMAEGDDALRRQKAYSLMFTMSEISFEDERRELTEIEQILFPGGAVSSNQSNDAEIVFNAGKYSRILVTMDGASKSQPGGILGNRERLRALGITVMSPEEAVELVQEEIKFRDGSARRMAELINVSLPEWVGRD